MTARSGLFEPLQNPGEEGLGLLVRPLQGVEPGVRALLQGVEPGIHRVELGGGVLRELVDLRVQGVDLALDAGADLVQGLDVGALLPEPAFHIG